MKITATLILLQATASAEFVRLRLPKVAAANGAGSTEESESSDDAGGMRVGLYYGSRPKHYSNTGVAASLIANAAGLWNEATNIADTDGAFDFDAFDSIIVGAPTYNTGEDDHRSRTEWDDWLYNVLPTIDVKGKNVAIFCTGKQEHYPEYYCDVAGELYDLFKAAGCNMFGFTDTDGYDFITSKAVRNGTKAERNGMFVGKMFDQKTQGDLSQDRAVAWVEQLREEGFFGAVEEEFYGNPSHNDSR